MDVTQPFEQDMTERLAVEQPRAAGVTLEFAAYALLVLLALALRLAQLDAVPMTDVEARQALAAWRAVQPQAPAGDLTPESPLLFFLHSLSFMVLGASEFSARVWTALGGLGLLLTPLLFRDRLGRGRVFILSLLLTFSPVLLVATRQDSPLVWMALFSMLILWSYWRYHESGRGHYAALMMGLAAALIFLTGPTGALFGLILLLAAFFAVWCTPTKAKVETLADSLPSVGEGLRAWPWQNGLLVAALVVVLISTLFMLYPAGLSAVSELLGAAVGGLTTPRPGTPYAFPLLIALFYEPALVILGMAAIWWLSRRDELTFVNRFLVGWLIFGAVASLTYAGLGPEHALWLILPLAGLVSALVVGLLRRADYPLWWEVPSWSKGLIALVAVALLSMFSLHVQALARSILGAPEGTFQLTNLNSASVVWVIISLLFMVIGFFLSASLWGAGTTARGTALGVLAFGLVTSLGAGWNAAVVTAESPVEFWNREPTSSEVFLLRGTLGEIANRETGGFLQISLVALAPDDGVAAWVLRDFVNARFISDVSEAVGQEIALLPLYNESPDLGGSYVGQPFLIRQVWNPASIRLADFLAWWLQRRTRAQGIPADTMVLWLRQDIYDGVRPDTGPGQG